MDTQKSELHSDESSLPTSLQDRDHEDSQFRTGHEGAPNMAVNYEAKARFENSRQKFFFQFYQIKLTPFVKTRRRAQTTTTVEEMFLHYACYRQKRSRLKMRSQERC